MTEANQGQNEATKDWTDQGQAATEWLTKHAGLVGGLLLVAGAVASLALALNKVRKLALWFIPVALYFAGIVLVAKPLGEHRTKMEKTQ